MDKLTNNRKQEIGCILARVYPALTSFGYIVSTAVYVDGSYLCLVVDALDGRNLLFIKTASEKETELIRVGITSLHKKTMRRATKSMKPEDTKDEKWLFRPRKGLSFAIWFNPKIIKELLNTPSKNVEKMEIELRK
jgi:hypothetical protein